MNINRLEILAMGQIKRKVLTMTFTCITLAAILTGASCNFSGNQGSNHNGGGDSASASTIPPNRLIMRGSSDSTIQDDSMVVSENLGISGQKDEMRAEDGNKRANSVNIKDYGAKGDGETNDTKAFVAAIDFIKKSSVEGMALEIPEGEYPISAKIAVNNIKLVGTGTIIPVSGEREFTIILQGNNNVVQGLRFFEKTGVTNLLTIDGSNNQIINCVFDGNSRSTSSKIVYSDRMLYLADNEGVGNIIKGCKINNGRIGVGLAGSYKLLGSEISNCIMGVWARPSTRNSEIANNIIRDNNVNNKSGADGILAQRNVSNLHIHGNKIYNSGEHGIYFQGDNSVIENNEVFNNHGSGIKLASYTTQLYNYDNKQESYIGHDNIIQFNKCYGNSMAASSSTGAGIYLQAPLRDITVSNNTCYDNLHGIRSTSVSRLKPEELDTKGVLKNMTFSNNKLVGNKDMSLFVEGETGIVITGNTVDNIMTSSKSAKHRLKKPIIRGNEVRGTLVVNRVEGGVIEDNTINDLNVNSNSIKSKHKLSNNKVTKSNLD